MSTVVSVAAKAVNAQPAAPASSIGASKIAKEKVAAKVAGKTSAVLSTPGFAAVAKNASGDQLELSSAAQTIVVAPIKAEASSEIRVAKPVKVESKLESKSAEPVKVEVKAESKSVRSDKKEVVAPVAQQNLSERIEREAGKLLDSLNQFLKLTNGSESSRTTEHPPKEKAPAAKPVTQPAAPVSETVPPRSTAPQPILPVQPSPQSPAAALPRQEAGSPKAAQDVNAVEVKSVSGRSQNAPANPLQTQLENLSRRYQQLERRFTKVMQTISVAIQSDRSPAPRDLRTTTRLIHRAIAVSLRPNPGRSDLTANLLTHLSNSLMSANLALFNRPQESRSVVSSYESRDALLDLAIGQSLDLSA